MMTVHVEDYILHFGLLCGVNMNREEERTENLFSYGTLQIDAVQIAAFGGTLKGAPDMLAGYRVTMIPIRDQDVVEGGDTHYRNIQASGNASDLVEGTVYSVTKRELEQADAYEISADYKRVRVQLRSGKNAWVYVSPMRVTVFIQNEAGSNQKHYHDEKTLAWKRTATVSRSYPFPYGFVVGTTTDDGCNVDCFVITPQRLKTGQLVECEVIGLMEQIEDGREDHNVLAGLAGENANVDAAVQAQL